MEKGIESFKASVLKDTEEGENCFNENGCDHEYIRMVPQDNQKLLEMGITQSCKRVSKCFHKYCDKYKWVMDRAKHYSEQNGKPVEDIIKVWEENRTYWYMNYYQEGNQPLSALKPNDDKVIKIKERIHIIEDKLKTYEDILQGLNKSYHQSLKSEFEIKIEKLKKELKNCNSTLSLFKIRCFENKAKLKD